MRPRPLCRNRAHSTVTKAKQHLRLQWTSPCGWESEHNFHFQRCMMGKHLNHNTLYKNINSLRVHVYLYRWKYVSWFVLSRLFWSRSDHTHLHLNLNSVTVSSVSILCWLKSVSRLWYNHMLKRLNPTRWTLKARFFLSMLNKRQIAKN